MSRFPRSLGFFLAALPAIGPLLLIQHYGLDFHYWDEWDTGFAGLFVRVHNHQFALSNLFVQNNEHRQVLPRLLLLLTNPLTHWNNFAVLLMGWCCACAISLVVLSLIRKSAAPDAKIAAIWFFCNALIFSPLQFEIWLWGIGLDQWMLTTILFLSFLTATSSLRPRARISVCLLLAAGATYCFADGMLAWPLTGILLLRPTGGGLVGKNKWGAAGAWAAGCLVCVGLYFFHYTSPPHWGTYPKSVRFADVLLYNLVFMGGAFAHAINYSVTGACAVIGATMLAMLLAAAAYFVWAYRSGRRELCDRMFVWFIVAAYAVFSGMAASSSRAGYGADQAISSRYIGFAVYLPLALVNLLSMIAADRPGRAWRYLPAGLGVTMILLQLLALPSVLDASWTLRLTHRQGKAALLLVDILPDNRLIVEQVGAPYLVIPDADILSDMGYLHPPLIRTSDARQFEGDDAGDSAPIAGRLEAIADNPNGYIDVSGWAINRSAMQLTDGVFLTYDDANGKAVIFAAARLNARRDDLVEQNRDPIYKWCGWKASFLPSQIPANILTTRIRAWVLDVDSGRSYRLRGIGAFRR